MVLSQDESSARGLSGSSRLIKKITFLNQLFRFTVMETEVGWVVLGVNKTGTLLIALSFVNLTIPLPATVMVRTFIRTEIFPVLI